MDSFVIVALDGMEEGPALLAHFHSLGLEVGFFSDHAAPSSFPYALGIIRGKEPEGEGRLFSVRGGDSLVSAFPLIAGDRRYTAIVCAEKDIRAAHAAGMRTVAVATGVDAVSAGNAGADVILSSSSLLLSVKKKEELAGFLEDLAAEDKGARLLYGRTLLTPNPRLDVEDALKRALRMAEETRQHAYAPYSHFKVGAAVVSAVSGRIYSGCNVENGSYGATICAERNAILHAVAEEGDFGIAALAVVSGSDDPAPPCALCLQVIAEFGREDTPVVLRSVTSCRTVRFVLRDLLPHPFVLE